MLRLTRIARDKVCQLPAQGWWFSPGTSASSRKTDRHDMTEILLKLVLNPNRTNKQTHFLYALQCQNGMGTKVIRYPVLQGCILIQEISVFKAAKHCTE